MLSSIRLRIQIIFAALLVGTVAIVLALNAYKNLENQRAYRTKVMKQSAETYVKFLREPLLHSDIYSITSSIATFCETIDASVCILKNEEGIPVVSYPFDTPETDHLERLVEGIFYVGRPLGTLEIYTNPPRFSDAFFQDFWLFLAVTIVFFVVGAWVIDRSLIHPFAKMRQLLLRSTDSEDMVQLKLDLIPQLHDEQEIKQIKHTVQGFVQRIEDLLHLEEESLRNKVLVDIASRVAHDIRSPLAALRFIVKNSGKNALPSAVAQLLQQTSERIQEIADDLLRQRKNVFSKNVPSMNIFFNPGLPQPLVPALRSIVDDLKCLIEVDYGADIVITFDSIEEISQTRVVFELVELRRLISNLVNNACQAIARRSKSIDSFAGRIAISVELDAESIVRVRIVDNGTGMTPEQLMAIENADFTKVRAPNQESGNGIGMESAFRVLRAWGAELRYESTFGEGTTAELRFGPYRAHNPDAPPVLTKP